MTIHIEAPVNYRHWTGRTARHPEADRLAELWPDVTIDYADGQSIRRVPRSGGTPGWIELGWCPASRTRWQRFWKHWHHGRLMGYPRLSVAVFCLRGLTWPLRYSRPVEDAA